MSIRLSALSLLTSRLGVSTVESSSLRLRRPARLDMASAGRSACRADPRDRRPGIDAEAFERILWSMKRALIALSVGVAVALAGTLRPAGGSVGALEATRIVDRTLSCAVGKKGGVRQVTITGLTGTRLFEDPSKWKYLATVEVRDESAGRFSMLGWVAAGAPHPSPQGIDPPRPEALGISASSGCKAVRASIPFSTTGLTGGAPGQLGDRYKCPSPRRVLVRVRGVFRDPTSLRRNREWPQFTANGNVTQGQVAVRTEAGKPLAYGRVLQSGRAWLLTAANCRAD